MTPHRKETNLAGDQPVRFYKIVAITFLLLTIALFMVIVFMSSKKATIVISTKAEPINVDKLVLVGLNGDSEGTLVTTTVNLEKKFSPTGSVQEPGVATGKVILYNDSNLVQPLVATTRLLNPEGVLFRLKERVVVPAKGQVTAEVYADQLGASGNIGPTEKFTVPGLAADRQKEIYAKSTEAMVGGLKSKGVLSTDDLKSAKDNVTTELEKQAKEIIVGKYADKSFVYTLIDQAVNSGAEVGKETGEYVVTGTATVLAVVYDDKYMTTEAESLLKNKVVSDQDILASGSTHVVSLENYDLTKQNANLKLTATGVVRLNPESQALDKVNFFGKSRDEVRRYLLSLEHINGVEVNFSPAWIFSIPHVADHVSVVVKESE